MKIKTQLLPMLAAIGILMFSGCASVDSRIQEKSYVFDELPAATKQRLKDGEIHVGDTHDMVYIALGAPSEKRDRVSAHEDESVWIYASYSRSYEGETFSGYQRVVTRNGPLGGYRVRYLPVTESVYSQNVDERFRVTFRDGRVTEIESRA